MWLRPRGSAASGGPQGNSEAGLPFKDALKGAKGPRPLHHHITGCHVEGVSLGEAAPCG